MANVSCRGIYHSFLCEHGSQKTTAEGIFRRLSCVHGHSAVPKWRRGRLYVSLTPKTLSSRPLERYPTYLLTMQRMGTYHSFISFEVSTDPCLSFFSGQVSRSVLTQDLQVVRTFFKPRIFTPDVV